MRRFRITGGPAPRDIRITDSETGVDLTSLVLSIDLEMHPHKLARVALHGFVEVDVEAVDSDVPVSKAGGQ
jgi:hypothetical protein